MRRFSAHDQEVLRRDFAVGLDDDRNIRARLDRAGKRCSEVVRAGNRVGRRGRTAARTGKWWSAMPVMFAGFVSFTSSVFAPLNVAQLL